MSFKVFRRIFITLIIALAAFGLVAPATFAEDGARVYLQPIESEDGSLMVEVRADNVTNLYGAEFRLRYNPAVVSVMDVDDNREGVQIASGTLLPAESGFVVANTVDEAEGTITFAMTLLNPAPAATGSGALAMVKFDLLQDAASEINVEHAKLVAQDLQTIPSATGGIAVSGSDVTNMAEAPQAAAPAVEQEPASEQPAAPEAAPASTPESEGFAWWIVAAVVMALGLLILGGLIMMNGAKPQPQTAATSTPATPRAASPQQGKPQRRRPSALDK